MAAWLFRSKDRAEPSWLNDALVVTDREEVIAEHVRRGSVLDLGIVDSWRALAPTSDRLREFASGLHESIRRINPSVLGVDIDAEGVAILQQRGYNVVCADVETMDLERQFDTIVAGEIIEHLPNPGRALVSLHKHLEPGGRLILTTCNPFDISQFWKIWRYNSIQVHQEHTSWFDPRTLGRLLDMSGFEVERLYWLRKRRRHGRWRVLAARWRPYFCPNFLILARSKQIPGRDGQR